MEKEEPSGEKILMKTNSYFLGTWTSFWTSPTCPRVCQQWKFPQYTTLWYSNGSVWYIDYFQAEPSRCLLIFVMARYLHGFYSLAYLRRQCDGNAREKREDKASLAENVHIQGDRKNGVGHTHCASSSLYIRGCALHRFCLWSVP